MVGFHTNQMNIREQKLFYVPFCNTNCNTVCYLILANKLVNYFDLFCMLRDVFKFNIYNFLNYCNLWFIICIK